MMYRPVVIFLLTLLFTDLSAQIVINGRNPARYYLGGPENAISISYGNIYWVDGKAVPLRGSGNSMQKFYDPYSIENRNSSLGVSVGYERAINTKVALRAAFSTAKLVTGLQRRFNNYRQIAYSTI